MFAGLIQLWRGNHGSHRALFRSHDPARLFPAAAVRPTYRDRLKGCLHGKDNRSSHRLSHGCSRADLKHDGLPLRSMMATRE